MASVIKSFFDLNVRLSENFPDSVGLSADPHYFSNAEDYFKRFLASAFQSQKKSSGEKIRVLEVGCGQVSYITLAGFTKEKYGYEHIGLDISSDEMSVNMDLDQAIAYDACNPAFAEDFKDMKGSFDIVVSHAFLEHVPDPSITHEMIKYLLKDTGEVVHYFPTLFDPPLLLGHLLPNDLAAAILFLFEPFRKKTGKFKTYYKLCRGGRRFLADQFEHLGYEIKDLHVLYGSRYLARIFPLKALLDCFYLVCMKCGFSLFASNVCIRMVKKK